MIKKLMIKVMNKNLKILYKTKITDLLDLLLEDKIIMIIKYLYLLIKVLNSNQFKKMINKILIINLLMNFNKIVCRNFKQGIKKIPITNLLINRMII